jgi:flavin reductase (DIM6/NTAB) family NADH-FMN oxidoreductase RutF
MTGIAIGVSGVAIGVGGRRAEPAAGPQPWDVARRSLVTGVAVLTVGAGGTAHGTTVSTVALASRRPPMVSVALRRRSAGLAMLCRDGVFAVNALAVDQAPLARYFADPRRPAGPGALAPDAWQRRSPSGVPLLRGVIAWLECLVDLRVPAGDHELVIARIAAAALAPGAPLVNFAGVLGAGVPCGNCEEATA